MQRTRFVLFASRGIALLPGAVGRALAAITNVTVLAEPAGHVVRDNPTGREVHVTLGAGPLIAADIRALAEETWRSEPEERAQLAATDARFELRYENDDAGMQLMLLAQDVLERMTGGFGYDLEFKRIVIAREGESIVVDAGPEQNAEDEREMTRIQALSKEELDRELTESGFDPEKIGRDGVEHAAKMMRQRDISFAIDAALRGVVPAARETRAALIAKLTAARAGESAVGGAIGWLLRDRGIATMSDGEVQVVVDELAKWA